MPLASAQPHAASRRPAYRQRRQRRRRRLAVALVASAIFGFQAGQPVTLGAISASISDLPAPWRDKARTIGLRLRAGAALDHGDAARAALAARGAPDHRRDRLRRRHGHRPRPLGGRARDAGDHPDGVRARLSARDARWRCGSRRCSPSAASSISPMRCLRPSSPTRAPAGWWPANRSANSRSICAPSLPSSTRRRSWRRPMARRSASRRLGGAVAVGARSPARSGAKRLGEPPPRRDDRRPARRLRRAGRRPVRRRDRPRQAAGGGALEHMRAALRSARSTSPT